MQIAKKYTKLATLVLVSSALLTPTDVSASGFLVARFGGEKGHPTTDSPAAIYFNPAGLALGTGTRIYIEGTFALRSVSYDRPAGAIDNVIGVGETGVAGTPAEAVDANSGEASLSNFVAAPFAAVVTDLGMPNLGVGASISV